ncbi:DNA-binding Lrp family transcriptional regulator [Kibdelosporangium banguiense]|uniref:DNA-binding Lrp family transcriptional regulator n=1 Tax=Kibdelosporangium banguiense TaxID=1365924 RepID=A0ABS4TT69_9PSEU|nr:Lrp/AsnC family transcriptional regulator [Kibdelosporangium banguiense]MBP2327603.1 DNA-binding Lrp family transcriptional regulator [Kibdelosporangium banguiense]
MDTVILDDVDRGLVHALQIDGRAPLRTIASVIGVSENTVARRYQRLRSAGVMRVVGAINGARLGYTAWTLRLQCTPDAATAVAAALADRPDTSWVYLLSGGTEISCNTQARSVGDRDALLLSKLPRTRRVTSVSAHSILRATALPTMWSGLHWLNADQVDALRPEPPAVDDTPITLDAGDKALLGALSLDGRTGYAELASVTDWSDSTVKRRMDHLRRSGVLSYMLDIPPAALGFHAEARLWMSVQPSRLVGTAETLANHPEVSFAAVTTGATNLTAAVNCRDTGDLYRFLTERVSALDATWAMETAPVIRTVKRAGTVLPV